MSSTVQQSRRYKNMVNFGKSIDSGTFATQLTDSKDLTVGARDALSEQVLGCYQVAMMQTDGTKTDDKSKENKPDDAPQKKRARLDDNDFDVKQPLSNFRKVTDDVFRSGRPLVDKGGLDQILDKLHPGVDKATQRKNTTIIELRDEDQKMDKPEITALNKSEVLAEEKACKTASPPIEYHHFKMISKEFQSPEKLDGIVSTIEKSVAAGKKVSLHCFHGSDRSGLVSATYLLGSDPALKQKLKTDPDAAYKEVRRTLIENGCDPASYTSIFRSLKQYCNWKHEQLNGRTGTDGKNPVAVTDDPIDAKGQTRIDDAAKKMFADKRFSTDPVTVYKEQLKDLSDDYDPATNSSLYKALKQKYTEGPPQAKPQPKGMSWLPNINITAA